MSYDERTRTTRLADDGHHLIIVERWLDRQVFPPQWRSKNWRRKLTQGEIACFRERNGDGPVRTVPTPVPTSEQKKSD